MLYRAEGSSFGAFLKVSPKSVKGAVVMTKNTGLKHKCGTLLDRDNVAGYVFILPFIIGLVVFTAIPFFTSLYLAFTKYNVLSDPKWEGLANFKEMFFLAAIKNIPSSYYEAAIVDGAGPVRRFFSITLPLLTPIIFFNLINQVIGAFQAFNSSYLITKGKPLNTTLYYGVHLYNKAFNQFEMGYGSAMAWFMLLIIAFFTALIFRSSSAWVYYESEGR